MAKVLCFNGEGSEAKDEVLDGLRCRRMADRPWIIDIIAGEVEIMEKFLFPPKVPLVIGY